MSSTVFGGAIPTLLKINPHQSGQEQYGIHNRWHPDIPYVVVSRHVTRICLATGTCTAVSRRLDGLVCERRSRQWEMVSPVREGLVGEGRSGSVKMVISPGDRHHEGRGSVKAKHSRAQTH